MHRKSLPLALAFVTSLAGVARAQTTTGYIEVSGAAFKPLPLAIGNLSGDADAASVARAVIQSDLAASGLFELLDPKSFLADESKEKLLAATIDFPRWAAVGADYLVKGNVVVEGQGVRAELRLFDVVQKKEALKASHTASSGDAAKSARTVAHRFADQVYELLTGEKGFFTTRLAFTMASGGNKELWVADWDGGQATALVTNGLNLLPTWSPDGRAILFTSYRSGAPALSYVDVTTKAFKPFPVSGDLVSGPAFSPDGTRVAFTVSRRGNPDVYVSSPDGTGAVQLTDWRDIDSSPTWSPDGKRLAFVSNRSGDPQVFVMNADGSGVERLTILGNYNQTPEWSPRGDLIAFTARDERNVFDLFTINVATRKVQRLTQDQGNNEDPTFSPNGRTLVFTSTRSGKKRLWVMNADGSNQRPLDTRDGVATPAWGTLAP